MVDKIKYINHLGEELRFGIDGLFANYNELRDFTWNFDSTGGKISQFNRGISSKKLPVLIACKNESDGITVKNKIFEIAEKDVLSGTAGKLIIGDYYYNCFITASKKSEYLLTKRVLRTELTVTSDTSYWCKESTLSFRTGGSSGNGSGHNLDYPFDYPYDFAPSSQIQVLGNSAIVAMPFKLVIYGYCVNPLVYVSSFPYQVNCTVADGEYLTIDSMNKTITLTQNDGTVVNKFAYRNRANYIFTPIPSGGNIVTWDGTFGFDITLIEQRSEPLWT